MASARQPFRYAHSANRRCRRPAARPTPSARPREGLSNSAAGGPARWGCALSPGWRAIPAAGEHRERPPEPELGHRVPLCVAAVPPVAVPARGYGRRRLPERTERSPACRGVAHMRHAPRPSSARGQIASPTAATGAALSRYRMTARAMAALPRSPTPSSPSCSRPAICRGVTSMERIRCPCRRRSR